MSFLLAVPSVARAAATSMALLTILGIVVESCGSLLVRLCHRLQAMRGFSMCEIAGDAATAFSMFEQGAFLDVHSETTLWNDHRSLWAG